MKTILLPIKPEYVERIMSGEKKFEYRKRLANNDVNSIVIYATFPQMEIVGEVEVKGKYEMAPSTLWEATKKQGGISRRKYREYFSGCKKAYAYELGQVYKYKNIKKLDLINIKFAPQSFIYLTQNQYEILQS